MNFFRISITGADFQFGSRSILGSLGIRSAIFMIIGLSLYFFFFCISFYLPLYLNVICISKDDGNFNHGNAACLHAKLFIKKNKYDHDSYNDCNTLSVFSIFFFLFLWLYIFYNLGVLVYEMLMASTPFVPKRADNVTELFTNIAMVTVSQ